ncbi:phage baseplate assembly protein V [Sorangium sp. So ce296]|uniref:Gp5/Type VI secretion system Vgr protein OB-fold domain-containing protein n=1 Tax=Sorangium cellulosum TaxID=56 RepID=A0A150T4R7_SORCE|nr:hypothetical protein BE18_52555 [Sorangium cellulosum]KYF99639.1 hypothetical protein BE20_58795 [Sorangium cellulosum]
MTESRRQFWGKYRARVHSNKDDYKLGRLQLIIPDVLGTNVSGWALPSFPYASPSLTPGGGVGLFLIPPKDAWVWAEFEHGDPERPIWTGCFFPADETALAAITASLAPLNGIDPAKKVLKVGSWVITVEDDSLKIEHVSALVPRARVKIDGTSLKLTNEPTPGAKPLVCATIELSGNTTAINGNALEVT